MLSVLDASRQQIINSDIIDRTIKISHLCRAFEIFCSESKNTLLVNSKIAWISEFEIFENHRKQKHRLYKASVLFLLQFQTDVHVVYYFFPFHQLCNELLTGEHLAQNGIPFGPCFDTEGFWNENSPHPPRSRPFNRRETDCVKKLSRWKTQQYRGALEVHW
jgi:hypothetical protein